MQRKAITGLSLILNVFLIVTIIFKSIESNKQSDLAKSYFKNWQESYQMAQKQEEKVYEERDISKKLKEELQKCQENQ